MNFLVWQVSISCQHGRPLRQDVALFYVCCPLTGPNQDTSASVSYSHFPNRWPAIVRRLKRHKQTNNTKKRNVFSKCLSELAPVVFVLFICLLSRCVRGVVCTVYGMPLPGGSVPTFYTLQVRSHVAVCRRSFVFSSVMFSLFKTHSQFN